MYTIGLLCGLISSLLYACMILTSRYLKEYYTGTAQAAWAIIITLVIFLPIPPPYPLEYCWTTCTCPYFWVFFQQLQV